MRRFSRTEQDQIMFEFGELTDEIIRLQDKRDSVGLSEWEYQTLKMKQKELREKRRKIWNSGH